MNLINIIVLLLFCQSLKDYVNHISADPYVIEIGTNYHNVKPILLSTFGKKITYIPLETKPECLIQRIYKVELSDSYIFIQDFNKLLVFDRAGKFVRQIGTTGRGPGEQTYLSCFCIDPLKNEVFVVSLNPNKFDVFSFNGELIGSNKLDFRPSQVMLNDLNSLIYQIWDEPMKDNPGWIITDRKGKLLSSIKRTQKRISTPGVLIIKVPFYRYDGKIYFMEYANDSLFSINKTKKTLYGKFQYGNYKMDPDPLTTPSYINDSIKYANMLWAETIVENKMFIFISLKIAMTGYYKNILFNKRTNETIFVKENVFKNDINWSVGFWPKMITSDGTLVDYIDSFDLLKGLIPSPLRGKITETSNPVLILLND